MTCDAERCRRIHDVDGNSLVTLVILALMVATCIWVGRSAMPLGFRDKEGREIMKKWVLAIALARSGRVAEGYELARTSLRQARDVRGSGRGPWAEELVRTFERLLVH